MKERSWEDRIGRYFHSLLKDYVFDEFSPKFLDRVGDLDFMSGVPVPFHRTDFEMFKEKSSLNLFKIAESMIWVLGIDLEFKYATQYIKYLNSFFKDNAVDMIVKEGQNAVEQGDLDRGTIFFRAALSLEPDNINAIYSYARVCREQYLNSTDGEYIGRFKAESIKKFELLTQLYPEFAEAYYYLGYDYLNMGLYQKAALTWKEYLRKSTKIEDRKEIEQRIDQLKHPIEIEKGCNLVLTGNWAEAKQILRPYLKTEFKDWWPLHYYLGISYSRTGGEKEALSSFKEVLNINPVHVESMLELVELFKQNGDKENERKYREKAKLILNTEEG